MVSIVAYHPKIFVIHNGCVPERPWTTFYVLGGNCSDWMSDLDFMRAIAEAGNVTKVGEVVTLALHRSAAVDAELAKSGIYDIWSETIESLPPDTIPVGWNYPL